MKTSSLKKIPAAKAKRAAVRFGRPPKELAGEVDARILDAARKIFLERGFEGASIDEIAEVARSGKPTIYARFRDKRAKPLPRQGTTGRIPTVPPTTNASAWAKSQPAAAWLPGLKPLSVRRRGVSPKN